MKITVAPGLPGSWQGYKSIRGEKNIIKSEMEKALIYLALMAAIFIPGFARADLGPKPTMEFQFTSESSFSITDGQQMECEDSECKDSHALEKAGPQGFSCEAQSCSSLAYNYAPYHKLVIDINGKKVESNIFKTKRGGNSVYVVNVSGDNLTVNEKPGGASDNLSGLAARILLALAITIVAEIIFLFLAIIIFKLPWKIFVPFFIANITSVSAFWFVANWLDSISLAYILIGEIIIVFYEALIYWLFVKKAYSFPKMLLLSFVLNLASFITTLFI